MRAALVLAAVALLAAGCGARSSKPFTAAGTAPCLKKQGFRQVTTGGAKVPFIARFAENGGLAATAPDGNEVTIAFTASPDEVDSTGKAFRRNAPPILRAHFSDVLRSNRNAVVVWTTSPSDPDTAAVNGCLRP
ncbi:MAG TPA: hypothetical protein VFL60_07395 [Gaiellaceae bacterium]|nr:hypothetical protein [Gaiellaceae bacterium]